MKKYIKPLYHLFLRFYHRISVYQYFLIPFRHGLKVIEIGSGGSRRDGVYSIDYKFGSDLTFDITKRFPLPDNSCDLVIAEHVLEHFDYNSFRKVLSNVKRVLKVGGKFCISVPDLEIFVAAYRTGDNIKSLETYLPAVISPTRADLLNYIFYMNGEHKIMFDYQSLVYHLSDAGFKNIGRRKYDSAIDCDGRANESLLMVCYK